MEPRHRIPPILLERARAMRHESAPSEKKLWSFLRNRQLAGAKFRRQSPIGPFIADFVCAEVDLIVELDGDSHAQRQEYDAKRTAWLEQQRYRVIRFWNHDVQDRLDAVLEVIWREVQDARPASQSPPHPNPLPRSTGGEGIREIFS